MFAEIFKTLDRELAYYRKGNAELEEALREVKAERDTLSKNCAHYHAELIKLEDAVKGLHATTPLDFRTLYQAHCKTTDNAKTNILYNLCGSPSY